MPEPGRLAWDPAGPDRALATACQDLRVGRYAAARDLLAAPHSDTDRRCHRLLVLAQIAAGNDAAERWLSEEPDHPEAALLLVRTAAVRAAQAHRERHAKTWALLDYARAQAQQATRRFPDDPVPWIALLHLAAVAPDNVPGPPDLTIPGPWNLMGQIWRRDPWNREAHHRLLTAVGPRGGGTVANIADVARWITARAPEGSALLLLPLLSHVETFKHLTEDDPRSRLVLADRQWSTSQAQIEIEACYERWFGAPDRATEALLPDLHYLAHALWASSMWHAASEVFTAIGPYALTVPWSIHGDPARTFHRARDRCLEGL